MTFTSPDEFILLCERELALVSNFLVYTIFVSSHWYPLYPEYPERTRVIVGSSNMGYASDICSATSVRRFHKVTVRYSHLVVQSTLVRKSVGSGIEPGTIRSRTFKRSTIPARIGFLK